MNLSIETKLKETDIVAYNVIVQPFLPYLYGWRGLTQVHWPDTGAVMSVSLRLSWAHKFWQTFSDVEIYRVQSFVLDCKPSQLKQALKHLRTSLTSVALISHLSWRCWFLMSSARQSTASSPGQDLQLALPFYNRATWRMCSNKALAKAQFFLLFLAWKCGIQQNIF